MKLSDARIGYAGYSRNFNVPGDRRRFAAYTRMKGVSVEYADLNRDYDLVYVTYSSDLPGWVARKRREGHKLKLVFELIDSYLTETSFARRLVKGSARYLLGTDSRLSPDLRRTLISACETADAVICSTEEQRAAMRCYNPNIFTSFDHFGDELGPPKMDYRRLGKLRLVWEGQSTTLRNIQSIREELNVLRDHLELHVVTDPVIHRYFRRFGSFPAQDALRGIECEICFHPWELGSFSRNIVAADLAVIPIDTADPMMRGKPENKLLMMWQLGMPVLTSTTPAYQRAMEAAGISMSCATPGDWRKQLERFIAADSNSLEKIGRNCRSFAERGYSKGEFISRFDRALGAIGFSAD